MLSLHFLPQINSLFIAAASSKVKFVSLMFHVVSLKLAFSSESHYINVSDAEKKWKLSALSLIIRLADDYSEVMFSTLPRYSCSHLGAHTSTVHHLKA